MKKWKYIKNQEDGENMLCGSTIAFHDRLLEFQMTT